MGVWDLWWLAIELLRLLGPDGSRNIPTTQHRATLTQCTCSHALSHLAALPAQSQALLCCCLCRRMLNADCSRGRGSSHARKPCRRMKQIPRSDVTATGQRFAVGCDRNDPAWPGSARIRRSQPTPPAHRDDAPCVVCARLHAVGPFLQLIEMMVLVEFPEALSSLRRPRARAYRPLLQWPCTIRGASSVGIGPAPGRPLPWLQTPVAHAALHMADARWWAWVHGIPRYG